ncbi:hypothetical protein [Synechococcus sp. CCY 9618]|uniref:hypothetical protein n=1 Tax=Synechococcus sp. CCY 9618 TaxID=2815602 RepID=UPI001C249EF4|nr:hypothetical protein [Synechococcus sp. CCY 9618]
MRRLTPSHAGTGSRRIRGVPRRRLVLLTLAGIAGLGWFFAPLLPSAAPPSPAAPDPASTGASTGPWVISALVDDPWRGHSALLLWQQYPGSILVFQGNAEYQAITRQHLLNRGLWPQDTSKLIRLLPGCDTVGQVTALARRLETWPRPGRLTIVTAETHMARTLAIARIIYAGSGWQVDGFDADTGDLRPESQLRLWRDQLRSSLWRLTGWDGRLDSNDCR